MQGDHGYGGGYGYGSGYGYDAGGYYSNGGGYPPAAAYEDPTMGIGRRTHDFPAPTNELEFQPSATCPKNCVIFDQTCTRSRVMFHPSLAHKLGGNDNNNSNHHNNNVAYRDKNVAEYDDDDDEDGGSGGWLVRQEDTEEIDALLSSEEDDVVSTGRTPGYRDSGSSPDSTCSSTSYGGGQARPAGGRKKERMKKMVRTLKGIIPGGNQMDTPAVLDEAVRYLKSLKVEVKKLGVRTSDS